MFKVDVSQEPLKIKVRYGAATVKEDVLRSKT